MSDYTASSLEEQVRELAEFVNYEADSAGKAVRTNIIVLIVISLILVGYFAILNSQIKDFTEPEELAKQAAVLIDDNIPDLAGMIEDVMTDASPELADFIANRAVQEGVPFLVRGAENILEGYVDQTTRYTSDMMAKAFTDIVKDSQDSIRTAILNEQSGDEPSHALKPLREKLHATFIDQTTGKPTEAKLAVNHSLTALQNLNKRLENMATMDPSKMDRKQQMSSRLLRTYWRWLRHPADPDTVGVDQPVDTPGHDH